MQEGKHTKIRLREWLKEEHPFRYLFYEEFGYFPIIITSALFYIIAGFFYIIVAAHSYKLYYWRWWRPFALATILTFNLISSKKRWKQTYCLSLDLDCEIDPDGLKEKIRERERKKISFKRIFLGVILAVILLIIGLAILTENTYV